jgi:hypothetical protein
MLGTPIYSSINIKNTIEQLSTIRHVRSEQETPKIIRFSNLERKKLSKLGNTLGKVVTKIRGTEKPAPQTQEKTASTAHPDKVYLKALPLRALEDVDMIKQEVKSGNILILKVSPLAKKSIDDVKQAVSDLLEFTQLVGGDIARLGEERVVITPSFIKIWREKTATPKGELPTAA